MVLLLLLVIFSLSTVPACAQSTLFYDLLLGYQPLSLVGTYTPPSISTSTTNPSPEPKVLGKSTSSVAPSPLPPIGGEGKVITVAVLGDSMVDTMGDNLPALQSALNRLYPTIKFNLLNYGFGASTLEHGLFRLTNSYTNHNQAIPSLLSQNPDLVIIESFAYNNYGNTQKGYDKQWQELETIIDKINKSLPNTRILLAAAPAPYSVNFAEGTAFVYTGLEKIERTKTIKLYLQNLVNFAQSKSIPLADAYHPSLTSNNEGDPLYINPSDNLHLSPKGISFFANIIAQAISSHNLAN